MPSFINRRQGCFDGGADIRSEGSQTICLSLMVQCWRFLPMHDAGIGKQANLRYDFHMDLAMLVKHLHMIRQMAFK